MYNDITTEERIDNYLLGLMSDDEKRLFEDELEKNAELKEEYECQKHVANAVQRVAMRDFLTKHAEERQQNDNVINLSNVFGRIAGRIKDYWSHGQRAVWTLASVAAMVVAIVGGINYTSTLNTMRSEGRLAYLDLMAPVPRDGNQIDALIEQIYNQIGKDEWDSALSSITNARDLIDEVLSKDAITEEDVYEHEILKITTYDLDWYETLILMKQGKVIKAKKLLESIASSDSPYAEIARKELDNIF